MNIDDIKNEVSSIKWWHKIDLGNGIITPGVDNSPERLTRIGLPRNLTGSTVLDIGAWDGFFSFEAEKRGANRVLAIDSFCWSGQGWGTKDGFNLARRVLNSEVADMEIDSQDISIESIGIHDIVLFLGGLYHMRYPLQILEKICSVTGKQLILETHVDMLNCKRPAMAFYPYEELRKDKTNWWGPNPAAVVAMLKIAGFKEVTIFSKCHSLPYRITKAFYLAVKDKEPLLQTIWQDRMVFHAFK